MGRKRVPGLIMRAGIWHIDKRIFGRRVCQSTGTAQLEEAERHLARVMEETRQAQIYGVRPARTFEQAAAKFVLENQHKRSLGDDVSRLKGLMPWIGGVALDRIHLGTLSHGSPSGERREQSAGTINHGLQIVRRILNLAAGEWMDEQGLTWLQAAPKIKLLANHDKRQPYPLSWEEQSRLFASCPTTWRRWHCLPSTRDAGMPRSATCVGLGGRGPGTGHLGLHHPRLAGEERRRSSGRTQPDRPVGGRGEARKACRHTSSPTRASR